MPKTNISEDKDNPSKTCEITAVETKEKQSTRLTKEQLVTVERMYQLNHYISKDDVDFLKKELGLSEDKIRNWFKRCRAKENQDTMRRTSAKRNQTREVKMLAFKTALTYKLQQTKNTRRTE